jgi:acetyl-CoA carboxylase biotin carboxyl carrier protein
MKKTPAQLQEIVGWMSGSGIGLLELRTPHDTVRLGRTGARVESLPLDDDGLPPEAPVTTTRASSVGVFLQTHPLSAGPLAAIGERVRAGQPLGLLQIGPLLLPVGAASDGVLLAMRAEHGAPVGYGTALADVRDD